MDKPKMPMLSTLPAHQHAPAEVAAHHAAWEAYVSKLRDLVLAAVPKKQVPATYHSNERRKAAAYNACRAETIANINALFDKENGNG